MGDLFTIFSKLARFSRREAGKNHAFCTSSTRQRTSRRVTTSAKVAITTWVAESAAGDFLQIG